MINKFYDYNWIKGSTMTPEMVKQYKIEFAYDNETLIDVDSGNSQRIKRRPSEFIKNSD